VGDFLDRVAVIDVEASGLHAAAVPIEVGWCLGPEGRSGSVLLGVRHWLDGAANDWRWDRRAESVHGLTRGTLLRSGLDAAAAAERVMAALDGRIPLSDSPNDARWLGRLLQEAGWPRPWPAVGDLVDLIEKAAGSREAVRALYDAALAETGGEGRVHRAEPDARLLWRVLTLAADRCGEQALEGVLREGEASRSH